MHFCTFRMNHPWEKYPLAHMQFGGASLLLFTTKAHTWLWDGGSLDLGEICQFHPWKGCSFEISPYTFALSHSSDPWETHPLAQRRNGSLGLFLYWSLLHKLTPPAWL